MIGTERSFSSNSCFFLSTSLLSKCDLILECLLIGCKHLSIARLLSIALVKLFCVFGDKLVLALVSLSVVLLSLCLVVCYDRRINCVNLGLTDCVVEILIEVLGNVGISVLVIGTERSFSSNSCFFLSTSLLSKCDLILECLLIGCKHLSIARLLSIALVKLFCIFGDKLVLALVFLGMSLIKLRTVTLYDRCFNSIDLRLLDSIVEFLIEVLGNVGINRILDCLSSRFSLCLCSLLLSNLSSLFSSLGSLFSSNFFLICKKELFSFVTLTKACFFKLIVFSGILFIALFITLELSSILFGLTLNELISYLGVAYSLSLLCPIGIISGLVIRIGICAGINVSKFFNLVLCRLAAVIECNESCSHSRSGLLSFQILFVFGRCYLILKFLLGGKLIICILIRELIGIIVITVCDRIIGFRAFGLSKLVFVLSYCEKLCSLCLLFFLLSLLSLLDSLLFICSYFKELFLLGLLLFLSFLFSKLLVLRSAVIVIGVSVSYVLIDIILVIILILINVIHIVGGYRNALEIGVLIILGIRIDLNDLEVGVIVNNFFGLGLLCGFVLSRLLSCLFFLSLLLFSISYCKKLCSLILSVFLSLLLFGLGYCEKLLYFILSLSLSVSLGSLLVELSLLGGINVLDIGLGYDRCCRSLRSLNGLLSGLCIIIGSYCLGYGCFCKLGLGRSYLIFLSLCYGLGIYSFINSLFCGFGIIISSFLDNERLSDRIVISYCLDGSRIIVRCYNYILGIGVSYLFFRHRICIGRLGRNFFHKSLILCILSSLLFSLSQCKKLNSLSSSLCLICLLSCLICLSSCEKLIDLSLLFCLFFLALCLSGCKKCIYLSSSLFSLGLTVRLIKSKHFLCLCSSQSLIFLTL